VFNNHVIANFPQNVPQNFENQSTFGEDMGKS